MEYNTKSGIYKITNSINGKFYIGSSIDMKRRWAEHKRDLRNKKHHSILLQRSADKYGKENFVFSILEYVKESDLLTVEQRYLDEFNATDKNIGFNISPNAQNNIMRGENHPLFGIGHTEETKLMMRGRNVSVETKRRMSLNHADVNGDKNPMYGRTHTDESKSMMSIKNKGRFVGEKSPRAKITREIAEKAKELHSTGKYTQHQLANKLNMNRSTLSNIIYGRSWA